MTDKQPKNQPVVTTPVTPDPAPGKDAGQSQPYQTDDTGHSQPDQTDDALPRAKHWHQGSAPGGPLWDTTALFTDCPPAVVTRLQLEEYEVREPDVAELIVTVLQLDLRGRLAVRAIRAAARKIRDGSLDLHLDRLDDRGLQFVSWAYCAAEDTDGFEALVDRLAVRVLGRGRGADREYVRLWNDFLRLSRRYARTRDDADLMELNVAGRLFHARAAELFRVVDRIEANLAQEIHVRAEVALRVFDEDFRYAVSMLADVSPERVDRALIELQATTYLVDLITNGFDDGDYEHLLFFSHAGGHARVESA